MPSSKYGTFRNRTDVNTNVTIRQASEFIEKSASSVDAFRESTQTNIKAVIISEQKEGPNEMILFTYTSDNVQVGEYISYRTKTYLIYGKYEIIFSNEFHKFKLIECSVTLRWGSNNQKAYFISSLRRYAGIVDLGTQMPYEFSSQKPIIVTKANTNFKPGTRFLIAGEGYIVNDLDKNSNPGIYYAYIEKATVFEDIDTIADDQSGTIPAPQAQVSGSDLVVGDDVTITTNFGYVVFTPDVRVLSKTATQVVFDVPSGVDSLTVETKDANGNIITTSYQVVV
jgi:hypothetical protein